LKLISFCSSSVKKYSELGWSVHITDDQKGVLIGDPWRDRFGSVTLHVPAQKLQSSSEISGISEESWFGYAVTSGNFLGPKQGVQYAASEMNLNLMQNSRVKIFKYRNNNADQQIETLFVLKPDWFKNFGEYFGYNLLAEDFNADGFSDLAVAAPLYSKIQDHENGAVYIYLNIKSNGAKFIFNNEPVQLTSPYAGSGRFGLALAKIGDINKDGFNDLAVGAPYEENGVVYIFLSGYRGLSKTHSQRIVAPSGPGSVPGNMMFGFAMSRGVDIDGNHYNGELCSY
jgi:FG-GAP repeat